MPYSNAKLYKKNPGRPKKGYTKTGAQRGRPTIATVKKIVKSEISRDVEDKYRQVYDDSHLLYPATHSSWLSSIFPVSPYPAYLQIDQGVGEAQRIGNVIKTKKLIFKGIIWNAAYNATSNNDPQPTLVNMWIISDREGPTSLPNSDITSQFVQLGNANQGLTDALVDTLVSINTDRYRVFVRKTFKLGYSAYTGTSADPDRQAYTNNDFKLSCKFKIDLTKHLPKKVKFNDNNSIPMTRGLFAVFQTLNANGTTIVNTQRVAGLAYTLDYHYEDA